MKFGWFSSNIPPLYCHPWLSISPWSLYHSSCMGLALRHWRNILPATAFLFILASEWRSNSSAWNSVICPCILPVVPFICSQVFATITSLIWHSFYTFLSPLPYLSRLWIDSTSQQDTSASPINLVAAQSGFGQCEFIQKEHRRLPQSRIQIRTFLL